MDWLWLELYPSILASMKARLPGIVTTTVTLAVLFFLRSLILRFIYRRVLNQALRLTWKRNTMYATMIVAAMLILPAWLTSLQELAAFLALFGAGTLIVMKEVILNISGWFYIIFRKPFEIGNRISVKGVTGDVLDIRLASFSILEINGNVRGGQSTGRIVSVPNSLLFVEPVANASKEFLFSWDELTFTLARFSDLEKAEAILGNISASFIESITEQDSRIRQSQDEYAIRFRSLTPGVFVEVAQGQVQLTLRYLAEPRQIRQNRHLLWKHIIMEFNREGIRFGRHA